DYPPTGSGGNERHFPGGEDVAPAGNGDVFTASGRQYEHAVERHDEREGFDEFPAVPPGEPAAERGWGIDGNRVHRDHPVAELGRTDIAVPPGLRHHATVPTATPLGYPNSKPIRQDRSEPGLCAYPGLLECRQVMSASAKPRLAGRQPPGSWVGCPG